MRPSAACFTLAVSAILILDSPAFANKSESEVWLLRQKHSMNGRQTLFINPTKLRIDNSDLGYSIIADSNRSTVWIFNDKKRLRFSIAIDKFNWRLAKAFVYANADIPARDLWKKVPGERIQNLETECFRCSEETTYFGGSKVGGGFLAGEKRKANISYTVFVTKQIVAAPALLKVIDELQAVPQLGGVPLSMKSFYSDTGTVRTPLETISAGRQKVGNTTWVAPSQYKTTDNISEVTSGDTAFLEDLVGK